MATKSQDKKGWRVQFGSGTDRGTIRLSGCSEARVDEILALVETLYRAVHHGEAIGGRTAGEVARLPDLIHEKLARVGLVAPRVKARTVTLGELWDRFEKAKSVKRSTEAVYTRVRTSMEAHFRKDRALGDIGAEHAEGWCKSLADSGLAPATRSKLAHVAKALFRRAILWGLLTRSPFDAIKPGPQTNAKRQAYIPLADLDKILEKCSGHEWRAIFGLARLAALRCPSEIVELRWRDVDFDARTMWITSPKTEHHENGARRLVPIVPRLYTVLMDAFHAAEPGAVYVVPRLRTPDTNLRTHGRRIIESAGLTPPDKLFVNMRASCATDWAQEHGGHVAAKWCGHSPLIALKHYAQVRPEDIDRATRRTAPAVAQKVAQDKPEQTDTNPPSNPEKPGLQGCTAGVGSVQDGKWAILDSNQ